jgi:hypothetical protein
VEKHDWQEDQRLFPFSFIPLKNFSQQLYVIAWYFNLEMKVKVKELTTNANYSYYLSDRR